MADNITAGLPPVVDETTQQITLGATYTSPDGVRKWRYAKAGAVALVRGTLLQSPVETTSDQNLAFVAASIGATTVTTTTTVTVTANQYAGGYVAVTVTPNVGDVYRIKSHPAATGAVVTLTLTEPLRVAWSTATRADLVANLYNGVIINPSAATGLVVGVASNAVAIGDYCWIQVAGPCAVLNDAGTVTVGTELAASNATAGAVEALSGVQQLIGRAITGIAANETGLVFLQIS